MSLKVTIQLDVSTDVSVRVPRGETSILEAGVADVLATIGGVTDVTVDSVTAVRPTWTDVRVDADARLTVEAIPDDEGDRPSVMENRLEDGVGVTDVNRLVVDEDE